MAPPLTVQADAPDDWQPHNQQWLDLHETFKQLARQRVKAPISTQPIVDVCVPHYNHGRYLSQTLAILACQTYRSMRVIVVDDASTDRASATAFEQARNRHEPSGWLFLTNDHNRGLGETRNIAAQHSDADYLIFVDADNVPLPQMVEQFVNAMASSGDDCLTCCMVGF